MSFYTGQTAQCPHGNTRTSTDATRYLTSCGLGVISCQLLDLDSRTRKVWLAETTGGRRWCWYDEKATTPSKWRSSKTDPKQRTKETP